MVSITVELQVRSCPFCKQTDLKVDKVASASDYYKYYIGCSSCLSRGPLGKTQQQALELFNCRGNQPKIQGYYSGTAAAVNPIQHEQSR